MSLLKVLKQAAEAAKRVVLTSKECKAETTGLLNPFGDQTLVLDARAEDAIIQVLEHSGESFTIITEERGLLELQQKPDLVAIIDPIDGSANLERRIPLCSLGISFAPFQKRLTSKDVEMSIIDSYFTQETYLAVQGKGVTKNGTSVCVAPSKGIADSIISFDTKKYWDDDFSAAAVRVLSQVKDMRRTASNLLDLCWVASGSLDAMMDFRGCLPIVHISGTHMVEEAGGTVLDEQGNAFQIPLKLQERMSFAAASNRQLAEELARYFNGK